MKRLMAVLAVVLGGCVQSIPPASCESCGPRPAGTGCHLGLRCVAGSWELLAFSCDHCTTPYCHDDGVAVADGVALGTCDETPQFCTP